ncbi:MAG TPA: sulfurase, partial [Sulfitobacter sp.]|nr:sulfurase [Sulfitobacter sp.]
MPALMPTEYTARITWLGRVVADSGTMRSEPLNEAMAVFGG